MKPTAEPPQVANILSFERFCSDVLRLSLTLAQLVLIRVVFDGAEPGELPADEREIARQLFGDVETIPADARHVLAWLKGARVGGSWICSLYLLYRALTADVSGLAPGEWGFCVVVAPTLKLAHQAFRYVRGAAEVVPAIKKRITSVQSDRMVLKRSDGREVCIVALPASRGGAATRGRTFLAALLDESSFFRDPDSGVVNDSEVYRSIVARVVPGGITCVISTAWLESGLLWDLVQANHGKPTTAVAAITPTLLMRPDDPKTVATVKAERARDGLNAAREYDCRPFGHGADVFFDHSAIRAAALPRPAVLGVRHDLSAACAIDPAFTSDAAACVVVRREGDRYRVAEIAERRPSPGQPLKPSAVIRDFCNIALRHGCEIMYTDGHYVESVREHAADMGVTVEQAPSGSSGKVTTHITARDLLHEGHCEWSTEHKTLANQLRNIVARPLSGGGMRLSSPRRAGRHGDIASAWVLAVWALVYEVYNDDLHVGAGGMRDGYYRSMPWLPAGATGVARSTNGVFYTHPVTGERRFKEY